MGEAKRRQIQEGGTNLGRRQMMQIMPTAEALLDDRIGGGAVAERMGTMAADIAKPPADRLQCFICAESWSMTRSPDFAALVESIDRAPAAMMGFICNECADKGRLYEAVMAVMKRDFGAGSVSWQPMPEEGQG